jgi:hypothetical protein
MRPVKPFAASSVSSENRKAMSRNKDDWGYLPFNRAQVQRCFECGETTTERHHVVPVSCGGTKVIPLCVDCRNKAHADRLRPDLIRPSLEKGRQAGWRLGRPRKVNDEIIRSILDLRSQFLTIREISEQLHLSTSTVHKVCIRHHRPRLSSQLSLAEP